MFVSRMASSPDLQTPISIGVDGEVKANGGCMKKPQKPKPAFMAGYKMGDGRGSVKEWREQFTEAMGKKPRPARNIRGQFISTKVVP